MLSRKKLQASVFRFPEEKRSRRPAWEYILLVLLLACAVWYSVWLVQTQGVHYRRIVLHQQLFQIRHAVIVYFMQFGKTPSDLAVLAGTSVADPRAGIFFPLLEDIPIDARGRLIDPFGFPYVYDRNSGRVVSHAPCCRFW